MHRSAVLLLGLTVALSACGSPGTPTTTPTTTAPDITPEAVATHEYTLVSQSLEDTLSSSPEAQRMAAEVYATTGERLSLQPLDVAQLGDKLRVVLNVERVQTGANAGKKRASVKVIWGNKTDTLSGQADVTLTREDTGALVKGKAAKAALNVVYPNFQDVGTYTTTPAPMPVPTCASVALHLTSSSGKIFDNRAAPLVVCEGLSQSETERNTMKAAAAQGLNVVGTVAAGKFQFVSFDNQATLPTPSELGALLGIDGSTIKDETLTYYPNQQIAPWNIAVTFLFSIKPPPGFDREVDILYHYDIYHQTIAKTIKKGNIALANSFKMFTSPLKAYTYQNGQGKIEAYLLGVSSRGVIGIKTTRFLAPPPLTYAQKLKLSDIKFNWSQYVDDGSSTANPGYYSASFYDVPPDAIGNGEYTIQMDTDCGAPTNSAPLQTGALAYDGFGGTTGYIAVSGLPNVYGMSIKTQINFSKSSQTIKINDTRCFTLPYSGPPQDS